MRCPTTRSSSARLAASTSSDRFSGGRREENDRVTPTLGERVTWTGFDTDVHVARRLYLLYSLEHDRSTATNFNQQYASLSWRF